MRVFNPFLIVTLVIALDIYVYRGLLSVFKSLKKSAKTIFIWVYWLLSLGLLAGVLIAAKAYQNNSDDLTVFSQIMKFNGVYLTFIGFKLIFAFFKFSSDIYALMRKIGLTKKNEDPNRYRGKSISRTNFIRKSGAILSMIPVLGLIHGIAWGKYKFTLHHKKIKIKNLPQSFNGFKIVQLSDAHLGSFTGQQDRIREVIRQINELEPDIMVFTGDMVNNYSHEMSGWVSVWKAIKSRYGKFSILGNHDYGDYSTWPGENAKKKNLQEIIRQEKEMGFDVLMNENREIRIGKDKIYIAGVENWGKPPFPQHGKLDKALNGIPDDNTTILLSHDPAHFDYQVQDKTSVDLTLSGHTHGFQLGIEIGKFKISPVQLMYKRWAGLYQVGEQFLYVNRGLGYLGFPGRVGIWPEVTLLELYQA